MSGETTFFLVSCVITDDQGKLLMLHRNSPHRTQWEMPGGRISSGEDPWAGTARKVEQALGVQVEVRDKLHENEFEDEGVPTHYIWFRAYVQDGQPRLNRPDDFDAMKYLSIDELKALNHGASRNTREFLESVERGDIRLEN